MCSIGRLFYLILLALCAFAPSGWCDTVDRTTQQLNESVLRVHVNLPNGNHGLGSAVVIAKDEVITNCHVVKEAKDVSVTVHGVSMPATAIKPDWKHDLCILHVDNLDVPAVEFGASKSLHYNEPMVTIGYPDVTQEPVTAYGDIKGLFPMDDALIIRATNPFKLGASGGGAFDEQGKLVGVITLKSRGSEAQYFFMPVEWVVTLMSHPYEALGAKAYKPFWAANEHERPFFMQVVQPLTAKDWPALKKVAQYWVQAEPATAESWFYLATAEWASKELHSAELHFNKVLELNPDHIGALEALRTLRQTITGLGSDQYAMAGVN